MITKSIQILLIDYHEIVRCGLRHMLEQEKDMEIVGEYSSAEKSLHQMKPLSPDIVLMDSEIPGIGGIEATRLYCQQYTPCNVIILTTCDGCLTEALNAGATGYLLKDIKQQDLVRAIRKVNRGELVIDERFALQVATEGPEYLLSANGTYATLVKKVELIIREFTNITCLLRFLCKLEGTLEATITQQIGSWDKGTNIIILLSKAASPADILAKLEEILEVKSVKEEPAAQTNSSHYKKFITKISTRPHLKFVVTLHQDNVNNKKELVNFQTSRLTS
ncbi:MAG: response regulator [Dehalococcoidales bacterium]|nr:response regulator [Dehalococcoidales bacterium]